MQLDESTLTDALARLRRVEGQVGGIIRMIESGRECREVVRQISAASRALDQTGFKILACGMRHCLRDEQAAEQAGYSHAAGSVRHDTRVRRAAALRWRAKGTISRPVQGGCSVGSRKQDESPLLLAPQRARGNAGDGKRAA